MPSSTNRVFIGVGSNLGNRESWVSQAFQVIRKATHFSNLTASSVYEAKPLGGLGEDYLNAVVGFDTAWGAADIHRWMMAVEKEAGRERTVPNAPRTLDLDLLFYGTEIISTAHLSVPHPRLHERAFVLIPLAEIAPHWIHPVYQKSILEMRNALSFHELLSVKKYENHSNCETISKNA